LDKAVPFIVVFALCYLEGYSQHICHGNKAVVMTETICPANKFVLEFADDFEGTEIDTNKWKVKTGVDRDPDQKSACQWNLPENVMVSDGTLKLRAERDTLINQCFDLWVNPTLGVQHFCKDFFFSGSEIASKTDFNHGKFEMRCKIPRGQGYTLDFWIWRYDQQNEIDIFEFNDRYGMSGNLKEKKIAKIHAMNIHNDYSGTGRDEDCPSHYTGPDFWESFHTFAVVWTPYMVQWLVDDKIQRTDALFYSMSGQMLTCEEIKLYGEYIINRSFPIFPMHMITNFSVASGRARPADDTAFPAIFEIDYIKYWRLE
jgi:beta-glucanase (GH16 family)